MKSALQGLTIITGIVCNSTIIADEFSRRGSMSAMMQISLTIPATNHLLSQEDARKVISSCPTHMSDPLLKSFGPTTCHSADKTYTVSKEDGSFKVTYIPI